MTIRSATLALGFLGASQGVLYCPESGNFLYSENVQWNGDGYSMYGPGYVGGKTPYNLLGGYVSWTMDTSQSQSGVNTNLYTISPQNGVESSGYCDIQENGSSQCLEMDMIEANGNCEMASTWHTFGNSNGNCDEGGCATLTSISGKFTMKATFSEDGWMTTEMNGVMLGDPSPYPSAEAKSVVVDTMDSIGAALWSSQWEGWVPDDGRGCPGYGGGVDYSQFTISDLVVSGHVVQGPNPTKCSNQDDDDNAVIDDDDDDDDSSSGPTCVTEYDYDYSGYDVSYDDVGSADDCCDGCAAADGCNAWTYSADQWGDVRCYYKSSTAGRTYSQGMVSGYISNDAKATAKAAKLAEPSNHTTTAKATAQIAMARRAAKN
jgi:hypothetical protein